MLSENQIQTIIEVLKPYNPMRIGLFGSYARNEESSDSDIDILYTFYNPLTLFKVVKIQNELEEKLQRSVDFVSEKAVHPMLRESIYNDLKIIYGN
ncbi:nucleotidyltransferase [Flavobacterium sp. Sd200]|uniref:nucleotidyltransferase family protein n=1 Tax=Flavobacterium sp. Sd200 TaxID=2692211 RepID=UPI001371FCED|nr:nucleotidyltransferase family protein [Flavobacterium sp. Sd200]MXN92128.1 nucleotidyltransferase [Flavobacterium sp. Sd200]